MGLNGSGISQTFSIATEKPTGSPLEFKLINTELFTVSKDLLSKIQDGDAKVLHGFKQLRVSDRSMDDVLSAATVIIDLPYNNLSTSAEGSSDFAAKISEQDGYKKIQELARLNRRNCNILRIPAGDGHYKTAVVLTYAVERPAAQNTLRAVA
jgi:hypothetical protein